MKSLLIGLMLIAVASAAGRPARKRDVNEILDSGAGWTKGADGYSYNVPTVQLPADEPQPEVAADPVVEFVPEEPVPEVKIEEPVVEVVEEIVPISDPVIENDYLPPTNEYLPPARRRLRFRRRYRLVKRQ